MKSPFKFLDPYEKKDKDIFFGRKKEIELLYDTTFETNLILVYGQSGTGKTSLIQCGLANRFRESDWFDIYIRRGDNINVSLQGEIRKKAGTTIEKSASVLEGIQSLYLDFLKPVYLIFDQFEELFILGSKEEQQEFFKTIAHLLNAPDEGGHKTVSCKTIFVMREEYIAWLYDFEKKVPGLFDNRIRLELMHPANVEEVIRGSSEAFGIQLIQPEKTVKGIIENNKDKKGTIRLPYLQVYLDRLYKEAAKPSIPRGEKTAGEQGEQNEKGDILFTPDLVNRIGKIGDVMAVFLDEQTQQIQQRLIEEYPDAPDEFVWQVLNRFVTVEGTNLPLQKADLYSQLNAPEEILDYCLTDLEKVRILRLSENEKTFEIAHDALALRIDDKRSVEEKTILKVGKLVKDRFAAYEDTTAFLTKGELSYIEPYEKKLKSRLDTEEINFIGQSRKKASKRRNAIVFATAAIIVILLLFATLAGLQWKVAIDSKELAEEKTRELREKTKELREAIAEKQLAEEDAMGSQESIKELKRIVDKKSEELIAFIERDEKIAEEERAKNELAKIAKKKAIEAEANRLAALAEEMVKEDPTIALRIAEKAWRLDKNETVTKTINKIYRENSFYKIILKRGGGMPVAISPNGKYILTGPEYTIKNILRLWDLQGKLLHEFKGQNTFVQSAAFSPDGKAILTGSWDFAAWLRDLQGRLLREFRGHKRFVQSVAFSPDGKTILTGSGDETARLWNLQGKTIKKFKGHKGPVTSVAFSRDGKTILTRTWEKTWLWSLLGELEQKFSYGSSTPLDISPDGKTILTGSWDGTARLWNLQGKTIQKFEGHKDWVTSVAFSPDGKKILTGSKDKTARLWDLKGKTIEKFKGHKGSVESVAFFPDGKTILTNSEDRTIRLWDISDMSLEDFLKKGNFEKLSEKQKRQYGIKD